MTAPVGADKVRIIYRLQFNKLVKNSLAEQQGTKDRLMDELNEEQGSLISAIKDAIGLDDDGRRTAGESVRRSLVVDDGVDMDDIDDFVDTVMANNGQSGRKYNQVTIKELNETDVENIRKATGGRVNAAGKHFAIEGGKLFHEIQRHSDPSNNQYSWQMTYDRTNVSDAIKTMLHPDIIEDLGNAHPGDQRESVAFVKKQKDSYIVVVAVGGKRNKAITPEMILRFDSKELDKRLKNRTVAELVYTNDKARLSKEQLDLIKKNRVTAASDDPKRSYPGTSETALRSPLFEKNVAQDQAAGKRNSLDIDSDDNALTESQQKYFENSKVRDDDGRLKVMYHGSTDVGFMEFDPTASDDGISLFFTDKQSVASGYSATEDVLDIIPYPISFKDLADVVEEKLYPSRYLHAVKSGNEYALIEDDVDSPEYEGDYEGLVEKVQELISEDMRDSHDLGGNYKVYLNLENPYVVDANGQYWNELRNPYYDYYAQHEYNTLDVSCDSKTGRYSAIGTKTSGIKETIVDSMTLDEIEKKYGVNLRKFLENSDYYGRHGTSIESTRYSDIIFDGEWKELEKYFSTRDIAQYAKDNGYDGVIFKNIVDIGKYGENDETSTVAIAFNSNQIKAVNNQNPTQDEDIRRDIGLEEFDFDSGDPLGFIFDGETVSGLAEMLRSGNETLKGSKVNEQTVRQIARQIKSQYGSNIGVDELTKNLTKVFSYAQKQDYINYDDLATVIAEVAVPVIDGSVNKVGEAEFDAFKDVLKGYTFSLDSKQQKEVISAFGSWGAFRKALPGVKFTRDGSGVSLDSVWGKLVEATNYALDTDVSSNDEPLLLADMYNSLRPTYQNAYGEDAEAASQDAAMQIVADYYGYAAEEEKSALKAEQKAKLKKASDKLKDKNKEYRKKTREAYSKRYKEQLAKVKATYSERSRQARLNQIAKNKEKLDWETISANTKEEALAEYKKRMEENGLGSANDKQWVARMQLISELYNQEEDDEWFERSELKRGLDKAIGEEFAEILKKYRNNQVPLSQLSSGELRVVNRVINNVHATPETFLHGLFGTKETDPITRIMIGAQNQKARDLQQAQEYMKEVIDKDTKKVVKDWMYSKTGNHNTRNFYGMDLTVSQVMSLYELMKRPDAQQHKIGGFVVDESERKSNGRHVPVFLTDDQIQAITDTLSDEQKRIADAMQYYMAHQCAEQGNETSMQLYGYESIRNDIKEKCKDTYLELKETDLSKAGQMKASDEWMPRQRKNLISTGLS